MNLPERKLELHKRKSGLEKILKRTALMILCCSLFSCSNTKYLPKGESLYTGSEIKFKTLDGYKLKKKKRKALAKSLLGDLQPKPNTTFLGLRPKLWFYNIAGKPKGKGLRYFLRNKLGEPPVLASSVNAGRNRDIITNRLENEGYFQAQTDYEAKNKNQREKIIYTASIHSPYKLNEIHFPEGDSALPKEIRESQENSLLHKGDQYKLDVLKQERERINTELKDKGYFYFDPDYLLFRADSNVGGRLVNLYMVIKPSAPKEGLKVYYINNVYLFPDYSLTRDTSKRKPDTTYVDSVNYVQVHHVYRPKNLVRSVFLHKGHIYTHTNYENTLGRLMGLGTFKFVNINFRQPDTNSNLLNTYINCTSMPRRSARFELRLISKSNNFIGPDFTTTWRNRNFLKGAELLDINLHAGYETLISAQESGVNSYILGVNTQLTVPRFQIPFLKINPPTRFVPKTIYKVGYEYVSRVQYFDMSSFQGSFGYQWNESETKQHEFYPISVNYMLLTNSTDQFNEIRNKSFFLQNSFRNQFIVGGLYSFTYNSQMKTERKHTFYFNGTLDASGNLIHLIQGLYEKEKPTADTPWTLFSVPYSQYTRVSLDFRHYLRLNGGSMQASRIFVGVGIPYGNSATMPYIKEFFSGGNNSVRAFAPRSLGPGSYKTPADQVRGFFIDQSGDIRLEANTEYRFNIVGIFKGALFADAGNIWLVKDDPQRPGGKFDSKKFMDELAVGTGAGLRIDASYFVLRFDLGVPLRKPYLPEGHRWVVSAIQPGSSSWRKNNLVLNIAIGYPF